jgi:hypothetical protein
LLTGGALGGKTSEWKAAKRERRAARRQMRTDGRNQRREARGPTILGTVGPGALIRGVKKFMHEVCRNQS